MKAIREKISLTLSIDNSESIYRKSYKQTSRGRKINMIYTKLIRLANPNKSLSEPNLSYIIEIFTH